MVAATGATTLTNAAPLGANAVSHRQGELERSGSYTLLSGLMWVRGAHGKLVKAGAIRRWGWWCGSANGCSSPGTAAFASFDARHWNGAGG